jgi:hypothetical protein
MNGLGTTITAEEAGLLAQSDRITGSHTWHRDPASGRAVAGLMQPLGISGFPFSLLAPLPSQAK